MQWEIREIVSFKSVESFNTLLRVIYELINNLPLIGPPISLFPLFSSCTSTIFIIIHNKIENVHSHFANAGDISSIFNGSLCIFLFANQIQLNSICWLKVSNDAKNTGNIAHDRPKSISHISFESRSNSYPFISLTNQYDKRTWHVNHVRIVCDIWRCKSYNFHSWS